MNDFDRVYAMVKTIAEWPRNTDDFDIEVKPHIQIQFYGVDYQDYEKFYWYAKGIWRTMMDKQTN